MMEQGMGQGAGNAEWRRFGWVRLTQVLLDSFRDRLGRELIPRDGSADEQARQLYEAAFVVVAHGTEEDPILCYGNRRALELWQIDADTLRTMPSRLTAEPMHRDERAQLLERTRRDGYADDYRGVRISRGGRRFQIEQAVIWNLEDAHGQPVGQAATFSHWQFLDD